MRIRLITLLLAAAFMAQGRKLLVISIDGMDARYLKSDVRIPHLRKFLAEGSAADGVIGVVPTVTWPSHTTMITGVRPEEHGILTNDQPGKPGQRWWFTSYLKHRTLWQAALEKNLKVATIYWPVTAGAGVPFNFPEFWEQRSEHEVLFAPIAARATPGLVERISAAFPAFPRSRWTDQTAMQALRFLLAAEQPDLLLVHIADLDSEQHENGAFTRSAKATLEGQDELIGWALEKLPRDYVVAIVSDHGFENADKLVRPRAMLRDAAVEIREGLIGALDQRTAEYFRGQIGQNGIAREVPIAEVHRMTPALSRWVAAFATMPGHVPAAGESGPAVVEGSHKGVHGLWPTRPGYRASFLMWGPGVQPEKLGEISMLEIYPKLAAVLGLGTL